MQGFKSDHLSAGQATAQLNVAKEQQHSQRGEFLSRHVTAATQRVALCEVFHHSVTTRCHYLSRLSCSLAWGLPLATLGCSWLMQCITKNGDCFRSQLNIDRIEIDQSLCVWQLSITRNAMHVQVGRALAGADDRGAPSGPPSR